MRIFLIGFMCAGKSRVGRELATRLRMPFIDLDRVIEERVGPLVPFFHKEGEAAFRRIESEVLGQVLQGPRAVVATGGGTPCVVDNMERMRAAGMTVWLDVPEPELMRRIERAGGDRPLLLGLKGEALLDRVRELLAEREPVYVQADYIVPAGDAPELVVQRIEAVLGPLQMM
jgi:shikimate kinase